MCIPLGTHQLFHPELKYLNSNAKSGLSLESFFKRLSKSIIRESN